MKKKFIYRTVITKVILSEEPFQYGMILAEVERECEDGMYIGKAYTTKTTILVGKSAVAEIEKLGSTSDFFNMDALGFVLEDNDDDDEVDEFTAPR